MMDAADYILLAQAYRMTGEPAKAVSELEGARQRFGDSAAIEYNLGISYARNREMKSGAAAFYRAVTMRPGWGEAWRNLARADYELHEYARAAGAYERASSLTKLTAKDRIKMETARKLDIPYLQRK